MRCHVKQCKNEAGFSYECQRCDYETGACQLHQKIEPKRCKCQRHEPDWKAKRLVAPTKKKSQTPRLLDNSEKERPNKRKHEDVGGEEQEERKDVKRPRYDKERVGRRFRSVTLESNLKERSGFWSKDIVLRGAQDFRERRHAQVLRWLSAQIFWFVKIGLCQDKEDEVQSMHVNDRIVVAANKDGSLEELVSYLRDAVKSELQRAKKRKSSNSSPINPLFSLLQETYKKDDRSQGNTQHFMRVFEGLELLGDDAVSVLMGILTREGSFFGTLDISNKESCREAFDDESNEGKILFVTGGGNGMHAEQKLVLGLYLSKHRGLAYVYGKKRPCAGCSLVLRYARERMGLDIQFNPNPGGYWAPSLTGLDRIVSMRIKRDDEDPFEVMQWLHEQIVDEVAPTMYRSLYLTQGAKKKKQTRKDLEDKEITFKKGGSSNAFQSGYDSPSEDEGNLFS
ncbi:hypothetical protein KYC5002_15985 [Archangium violaceum]|uniref:hypothetical protein n=1 Tax=Archangium violaceum TaxID=83451 RepID=UPI002B281C03|nr:hypothetical protein KYC5002_15985 [Archangium gephyra]